MSLDVTNLRTKLVEHSGANNAYLKSIRNYEVPSAEEEVELCRLAKKGDKDAKDKLVMGHQRLIYSFAKQYAKNNNEIIDYVNEGTIGLIKAIDTYDETKGFRFITYASYYIRREMRYFLSSTNVMVERSNFLKLDVKLKQIKHDFYTENGYYPSVETIIDIFKTRFDINIKDKSDVFDIIINSINIGKDEDYYNSDVESMFNFKTHSHNEYEYTSGQDYIKECASRLINTLPERDADVIKMLYGIGEYEHEYSISDVADKYNLNVATIGVIKKKALIKMSRYQKSFKIAI